MNKHSIIVTLATIVITGTVIAAEPTKRQATPAGAKPLTFDNVRKFFSDTLKVRPKEVQKRCALFYEGDWKDANTYRYSVIIVENSDEDIQITFYFTDDYEMNWVNEFIEGPFFTKKETEELFGLVHRKRHTRAQKVGRFRVDVSHWEPRHAEIIVLSFTPPQKQRR